MCPDELGWVALEDCGSGCDMQMRWVVVSCVLMMMIERLFERVGGCPIANEWGVPGASVLRSWIVSRMRHCVWFPRGHGMMVTPRTGRQSCAGIYGLCSQAVYLDLHVIRVQS